MATSPDLKVISANRLQDGIVVYLSKDGWTSDLGAACRYASDDDLEPALAAAKEDVKRNLIVDPFAVEVEEDNNSLEAVSLRNAIRANGPTIEFLPPSASSRS